MDNRAQSRMAIAALGGMVALVVVALLAAIILPSALNALSTDQKVTINQTTSSTEDINPDLNTTLDATTADTDAQYTLQTSDQSIQKTINVGANDTYSFNEGDVVVGVEEAKSGHAIANYTYPDDFAWSGGAGSLWTIIDFVIILAPFLFIIAIALAFRDKV